MKVEETGLWLERHAGTNTLTRHCFKRSYLLVDKVSHVLYIALNYSA